MAKAKKKAKAKRKPAKKADKQRQNTSRKRTLPKELEPHKWKPGQSGNPKGRPKKQTMEEVLSQYLQVEIPVKGKGKKAGDEHITRLEAMVRKIFALGVDKENAKVLIAIMDRLYPKPIILKGDPENPVVVEQDLSRYSTDLLREMAAVDKKIAAETSGE